MMTGHPRAQEFAKSIQAYNQSVLNQIQQQRQTLAANNLANRQLDAENRRHDATLENQRLLRSMIEQGSNNRQTSQQNFSSMESALAHARALQMAGVSQRDAILRMREQHGLGMARLAVEQIFENEQNRVAHFEQLRLQDDDQAFQAQESAMDRLADQNQRKQEAQAAAGEKNALNMQKFNKELNESGMADMKANIELLDSLLAPYVQNGRLTKRPPGAARGLTYGLNNTLANLFDGEEGARIKAAYNALYNQKIKIGAGTAVSGSEFSRTVQEFNYNPGNNYQEQYQSYLDMRNKFYKTYEEMFNSFGRPVAPDQFSPGPAASSPGNNVSATDLQNLIQGLQQMGIEVSVE